MTTQRTQYDRINNLFYILQGIDSTRLPAILDTLNNVFNVVSTINLILKWRYFTLNHPEIN